MKRLVHDPRVSSDRSEMILSDNPALIMMEEWRAFFAKFEVTMDDGVWADVARAANYCDETIGVAIHDGIMEIVETLTPP